MISGAPTAAGSWFLSTRGIRRRNSHIGQANRFGGHPGVDLGRGRDARLSLSRAQVLIVPHGRHQLVEPFPPQGNLSPGARVDAKMRDTFGRVDDRDGRILGPAKRPSRPQCDQDAPVPARSARAATGASRLEKARRPEDRDGRSHESKIARQSRCSHAARPPRGRPPGRGSGNASASRPGRAPPRIPDRLHPSAPACSRRWANR